MIFEQFQLPNKLDSFIESILYFKDFTPEHTIERIVPTGHTFIIFELDNIPRNTYNNETLKPTNTFSKVWISGPHRNYLSISAHEQSEMLVIQFKPTGAHPFFHRSIQQITDEVLPGEDFFGEEILELRTEIYKVENPDAKFKLVSSWLEKRFDRKKVIPENLLAFIEKLHAEPQLNLKSLTDSYPATQKQLIEHFKKYVGLTPKYYHRILRFNEILKKINQKEKISWADIAYSCDYTDQSHFIKEFFLFSGFNPQEFIQLDFSKEQVNFFPLDRKG